MESKDVFSEAAVGAYYEKVRSTATRSGFPVKEIYTPEDIRNINYDTDIADAGEYPFTRGIHPNMYRGRLWTIRQGWGFGIPGHGNSDSPHKLPVLPLPCSNP